MRQMDTSPGIELKEYAVVGSDHRGPRFRFGSQPGEIFLDLGMLMPEPQDRKKRREHERSRQYRQNDSSKPVRLIKPREGISG